MTNSQSPQELQQTIIDQIDAMVRQSEEQARPLEIDPARSELFALFVKAETAGLTGEESDPDLSADGICQVLSDRWGLKAAAQDSVKSQVAMTPVQLSRMRSLWSVMRMWMEWTYAWKRWPDFH